MTYDSSNDQFVQALVSYLPPAVARAIHTHPHAPVAPRAERFPATVLLADVSGFTSLTEKLAARGPGGAEELTLLLNRYFSRMIGLLEAEGGEVVQFSGDALTAVFPAENQSHVAGLTSQPNDAASGTTQNSKLKTQNLQWSVRRAWQAA